MLVLFPLLYVCVYCVFISFCFLQLNILTTRNVYASADMPRLDGISHRLLPLIVILLIVVSHVEFSIGSIFLIVDISDFIVIVFTEQFLIDWIESGFMIGMLWLTAMKSKGFNCWIIKFAMLWKAIEKRKKSFYYLYIFVPKDPLNMLLGHFL